MSVGCGIGALGCLLDLLVFFWIIVEPFLWWIAGEGANRPSAKHDATIRRLAGPGRRGRRPRTAESARPMTTRDP